MMETIPLNIAGPSRFSQYAKVSRESTYNMRISDGALVTYPGYRKITDIKPEGSQGRTSYQSPKYNHLIAVIDDAVYSISNDYAKTFIGSIDTFSGPVFISENDANQIVISENTTNVYVFNYQAQTFSKVDVGFIVGYITFIDGYIVAPSLGTNQWRLSALNDATSFPDDAQHVGLLQSQPDTVIACETLQRQLFVFGKNIADVFLDLPSIGRLFPFQRQNSLSLEYGCVSPNTISSAFGRIVWLGKNEYSGPTILVSTGGKAQKISTDGIEFELDRLKFPEDSFGALFEEGGHIFYQITFPSDNVSYSYDFDEGGFVNVTNASGGAHILRKMAYFNDRHVFITDKDGGLYEMGDEIYTYKETLDPDDKGFTVPRARILPSFRLPDASRFIARAVNITVDQGYTDIEMKIDLSLSKDGGHAFGNTLSKSLRKLPNRANKLIYRNLGAANDLVCQFKFWGKDRFVVIGGELEVYQ